MTFDLTDDLSGDGMVVIDGVEAEAVYYWLTVVPETGAVFAEGSISGLEQLMKRIKKAGIARLSLLDGPVVRLECEGGKNGVRWVRAFL